MFAHLLQARFDRIVRVKPNRSPRRALAVGALAFVAATLGSAWALERSDALRDPVFGQKEELLQRAVAQGRPLILVMGSSRVENGVHADHAEAILRQAGRPATVFNFGSSGAGPITTSVYLRRLLARGIVPDRIVIEVLPKLLSDTADGPPELAWLNPERFSQCEREELERLSPKSTAHWHKPTGMPWIDHSNALLFRFSPSLLPNALAFPWSQPIDGRGWNPFFQPDVTPELRINWTARAERECRPNLASFQAGVAARAFRQLIDTCRERGIPVHLLLMPEGTVFHGWYGPNVNDQLMAYLATLRVRFIDARHWMPDDAFADGHHLLPHAATAFSERLATDVLRPMTKGRCP